MIQGSHASLVLQSTGSHVEPLLPSLGLISASTLGFARSNFIFPSSVCSWQRSVADSCYLRGSMPSQPLTHFSLPAELRNDIYELFLVHARRLIISHDAYGRYGWVDDSDNDDDLYSDHTNLTSEQVGCLSYHLLNYYVHQIQALRR